jgi:hypothetical protein
MHIRLVSALAASLLIGGAAHAFAEAREYYQGRRGPEQSDSFSRKVKVGANGRVSISNISGAVTVATAAGDEVSIDAVKHTRGDRRELDRVQIVVDDRPGRVDVRTDYGRFHDDAVWVDYTVVVPPGVSLDVNSVSGRIRVDGVKGSVRVGTVSGNITSSNTPKVEYVRTVSSEIDLVNISHDGNVSISTISGNIRLNGVKVRSIDLNTVSGEIRLTDASCERLTAKALSGNLEYSGTLVRNGHYEVNTHSGGVRFALADSPGFELSAGSFSGSIRSEFQMTVGGARNPDIRLGRGRRGPGGESLQATSGDGSASLTLHTFSGNIVIAKR